MVMVGRPTVVSGSRAMAKGFAFVPTTCLELKISFQFIDLNWSTLKYQIRGWTNTSHSLTRSVAGFPRNQAFLPVWSHFSVPACLRWLHNCSNSLCDWFHWDVSALPQFSWAEIFGLAHHKNQQSDYVFGENMSSLEKWCVGYILYSAFSYRYQGSFDFNSVSRDSYGTSSKQLRNSQFSWTV